MQFINGTTDNQGKHFAAEVSLGETVIARIVLTYIEGKGHLLRVRALDSKRVLAEGLFSQRPSMETLYWAAETAWDAI